MTAVERIETVLPSPREADLLETTTAMPMLLLNRRSLDVDGAPIETVRALYRGDRVAFEANLNDRSCQATSRLRASRVGAPWRMQSSRLCRRPSRAERALDPARLKNF